MLFLSGFLLYKLVPTLPRNVKASLEDYWLIILSILKLFVSNARLAVTDPSILLGNLSILQSSHHLVDHKVLFLFILENVR